MRTSVWTVLIAIIIACAVSMYVYPILPDRIAVHWGLNGEADGYASKFWGLALGPLLAAFVLPILLLVVRDERIKAHPAFIAAYSRFVIVFSLFFLYVHGFLIAWNLGWTWLHVGSVLAPALGILFFVIGHLMEHSRQNWFIGVRTPWTLQSEEVWKRTHRLGGRLFKISGLISVLGAFLPAHSFFIVLVPVILSSVICVIWSYVWYQKERSGTLSA